MAIKLNREAWEPCRACRNTKRINGNYTIEFKTSVALYEISARGHAMYCPWCSRPLTDAAWAALEERIRRCAK